MNAIKYKIKTLGCKVNQYDSAKLSAGLLGVGFELTNKEADLVILNTCAVTKTAIHKAKRALNELRKNNPGAKIVLMGCWPKAYKNEMTDFQVDLLWEVGDLENLKNEINNLFFDDPITLDSHERIAQTDRSRYFIKIQDGCEQFCTYCVIPYTRGKIKSRASEELINEIQSAIKQGFEEIVLSGIHLGLYGQDMNDGLFALLKKIIKIENLGRIRLSSIEVGEVSDEIIDLIKSSPKICNHLHIPLQSGNDLTLKRMKRPYTSKEFFERIRKIRKSVPDIAITTDVIVGFPGESKEDFYETIKFIKKINFSILHVFPFSAHEKTPAFSFSRQVSVNEKKERAKILRDLSLELERSYKNYWIGRQEVICLESMGKGKTRGLSEHFVQFEVDQNQIPQELRSVGKLAKVKIG